VIYRDIIGVNKDKSIDTNWSKSHNIDKVVGRSRDKAERNEVVTRLPHLKG
jgi:hypothetical protein